MITAVQTREAEESARLQRMGLTRLLQVDESKAAAGDIDLIARVKAAARGTGPDFDRALADPAVNSLFRRGVLTFGPRTA